MTGRYRIIRYLENNRQRTTLEPAQAEGYLAAIPPSLHRLFEAGLSIRLPFDTFIQKINPTLENYDGEKTH